jgi:hypothetical protein
VKRDIKRSNAGKGELSIIASYIYPDVKNVKANGASLNN